MGAVLILPLNGLHQNGVNCVIFALSLCYFKERYTDITRQHAICVLFLNFQFMRIFLDSYGREEHRFIVAGSPSKHSAMG